MSSGVERVYDVDPDGYFAQSTLFGANNEGEKLVRLKNTIEPSFQYDYVPDRDQETLPFFDVIDHYRSRSLFTYGVRSHLYGRYLPPLSRTESIGELAPSEEDLPTFDISQALQDFGTGAIITAPKNVSRRVGEVRDLLSFGIKQTYDYYIDTQENQSQSEDAPRAFSDLAIDATVSPSEYFAVMFNSNYDPEADRFDSYGIALGFRDDRGDVLRGRYSFTDPHTSTSVPVNQIEGNAEVKLLERLRLGYYARYDNEANEFIDQRGLVRFNSSCNCWHIDTGFVNKTNPNESQFVVEFTFNGLGTVSQGMGLTQQSNQSSGQ